MNERDLKWATASVRRMLSRALLCISAEYKLLAEEVLK